MRTESRTSTRTMALVVGLCGLTLLLGYLNKARCAGTPFTADGRSLRFDWIKDSAVCYSDIQHLWIGRGINLHLFPYVDGNITPDGILTGGSVEYPVLSGALMWLGALGAHNDAEFLLYSALLLAPFGLFTAWMLGRLSGRSALLWSAGPPLVLYAFHNWELPVVAAAVGAVFVMTLERIPLRTRAVLAAVVLAIGFCLKLYPGAFVLPLMVYVLTGGAYGRQLPAAGPGRYDVRGAACVGLAAAATVIAVNLPFALTGYPGWRASFAFQADRTADLTSNSIWYWGLRPLLGGYVDKEVTEPYQHAVGIASPLLVVASFGLALWLGWKRYQREGTFPWIAVSASMLCGFLLLHKVHSPQYTLWLIPFFVLLRVPWSLVGAYLLADLAMGIGVFRYFDALATETDARFPELLVLIGVWGRAALLAVLFFGFARASLRRPPAALPGDRNPNKHESLTPAESAR